MDADSGPLTRTTDEDTELKAHVLQSPLAEPFAFSQGWVRQRSRRWWRC